MRYPCLPVSYPCVKNTPKTMLASVRYPTGPIQDIGHLRIARPDHTLGSISEFRVRNREVRSTLKNGHGQPNLSGPKSAAIADIRQTTAIEIAPSLAGHQGGSFTHPANLLPVRDSNFEGQQDVAGQTAPLSVA